MESNWPTVKLGGYCRKIGSGATPKGGSSVYQESSDTCLIRSQNVHNGGFNESGLVYIDEAAATKLKNVAVERNDILLNITGDSVARVCLASGSFLPARVNQHVAIIRPNADDFDSRFLRYVLVSPRVQALLLNLSSAGATRNALTKSMIEDFEVSKPPLNVQVIIADILESLDNKIALNRQINQTLEQMTQALFKSWFVDFDPVVDNALDVGFFEQNLAFSDELLRRTEARRAVRENSAFKPLPDAIRQLFPASFEECTEPSLGLVGWVPKGWKQIDLSEVANIIMGQSPKGETYNDDGVGIPLVNGPVEFGEYHPVKTKWTTHPTKISKKSDLIVCVRGSTTGRFVISDGEYCLGRGVCAIRAGDIQPFVTYQFKYHISTLLGLATGSTFPSWSGPTLKKYRVLKPQSILVKQFCKIVSTNLTKMSEIDFENITLTNLRDTLLPKLISGELRLNDSAADIADEVLV